MKKIFSLLLAIAMIMGVASLCVSAVDYPVGQFIFDSTMNVSWWQHHASCTTEYDSTEDAFKITPAGGNAVMTCGHNAGTIDYFEDMGRSPVKLGGEDGYNFVKIKIKLPAGFDISGSSFKAVRLTVGDNTKGLAAWNTTDNPTFDLGGTVSDGEWHEYVADLRVKHGVGASFEGTPSWFADNSVDMSKLMIAIGSNVEGPVYIKYIAFFKTADEANSFNGTNTNEPSPSTGAYTVSAAIASVAAISLAGVVFAKKKHN